jgi:uroporphyrinogen decarboxylase
MNSSERVDVALRGGTPDRVPVVEFVIDPGVMAQAVPEAHDVADGMDRLDMDAVSCGVSFANVADHPDGTWVDEWGVTYKTGPEVVAHPLRGPIRTMEDLEAYQPPDPLADGRLGQLPELVRRYKGKRAILFHQRAAFMWSAYLMGIDNLLMAMATEPDLAEALMDRVLEVHLATARRAVQAGAEVIILGDDYAYNTGPMFSPAMFRTMILPRLTRMVETIHQAGGLCVKHSDGNLYPILDDLVSCGCDGLNPIEPVAGMSLAETRRRVGPELCLVGNIDCAHLLPHGSPGEVRQAVRQAIAEVGAGGGLIVSSSNSVHSSCRADTFVAMIEAVHELGTYPLNP